MLRRKPISQDRSINQSPLTRADFFEGFEQFANHPSTNPQRRSTCYMNFAEPNQSRWHYSVAISAS
jgi:hypothetical protein